MSTPELEDAILARGREFFERIGSETPSVFNKNWWTGKVMDFAMGNERFKVQLFRFIDVLPSLTTDESLARHIREYFGEDEGVPKVLRWGFKATGLGGRFATRMLGRTIRKNLERMARDFIVGAEPRESVKALGKLRKKGFGFTLDVLGEATITEDEADAYVANYLDLLDALGGAQHSWPALGGGDGLDWGDAPKINVSLKPSALYSQVNPVDFEGSVTGILARLEPIARKVVALGGSLCIDIEMRKLKSITFELFRRLRSAPEFRDYPRFGIAVQTYLREADEDVEGLLDWARREGLPFSIRLVKGAYWDYETALAAQYEWPVPVYTVKEHTDAAFERNAVRILRNHDICHLACASHNVRSVSTVLETARALGVPEHRYEFQALYGMAEPFRKALLGMTDRVRLYCPHGDMLPGMAYLIRRLLENTSNESFLKQTFVDSVEMDRLLAPPRPDAPEPESEARGGFHNEPFPDWERAEVRERYARAITEVRGQLGKAIPLHIGGEDVTTEDLSDSVNPAQPSEVIGTACQAGPAEAQRAIAAAKDAFPAWRDTPETERAAILRRAADSARDRIDVLSAWMTLEGGKQWQQGYLDTAEAIDFLDYYADEIERLATPRRMGNAPGEANVMFYQPKGVAAVIAPWNFPLAISCGMCAAALAAGNTVVFKPSRLTPVIGRMLCDLLREAGVPAGAFNYLPGRGSQIGDLIVEHPDVALIAFTGSMDVGLRIIEKAARTREGQMSVKKVIAEMGGKNAIIIDDDADLDEAVPAVIYSAFGYQGQKCSACSRVIVLDAIYDRFIGRLVAAARSMSIGPAEDPANVLGPVIDGSAQQSIREYIALAEQEGTLLFRSHVPEEGFYVPVTIVGGITPEHRIAQEEVFGPVLAVMRAESFEQALAWANSTRFALTGGVFSRSPGHLDDARREFRVGNLYLNRGCTGAIVARQPFGGFKRSGIGSKAGGPDYLLQFLDPRTVTENTMRRGFVPVPEAE